MRFDLKIMICVIMLLALTFGAGGSMLIAASFEDGLGREQESAAESHSLVMYTLTAVAAGDQHDVFGVLSSAMRQMDEQDSQSWELVRLYAEDGVLYESRGAGEMLYSGDLTKETEEDRRAMVVFRGTDGEHLLQVTGQLDIMGNAVYLDAVYNIDAVYLSRHSQQQIFEKLFAVIMILGVLITWILARWLTRPLRKLSKAAREVAQGDLSVRAEVGAGDEIGKLSEDFNYMTERLQENITELQETMRRQEQFMGDFAHELKTPMTSIIGYADLLRGHEMTPAERREAANYIFSEGRRLENISFKLLDLIVMKRRDFTFEEQDPARLVREIEKLIKPTLSRSGIKLVTRCESTTCRLEADFVKSLIINLIDNAKKAFDNEGGIICVETGPGDGGCFIRVSDNGRGIPQDKLKRITEAFYRVDKSRSRSQGGAGLGLALCQEIAQMHGGRLEFESIPGEGTRVTAWLKGGGE